ncbi:hypothetical protein GCM10028827_21710 [Mucilaginibacter myungsuensis]
MSVAAESVAAESVARLSLATAGAIESALAKESATAAESAADLDPSPPQAETAKVIAKAKKPNLNAFFIFLIFGAFTLNARNLKKVTQKRS